MLLKNPLTALFYCRYCNYAAISFVRLSGENKMKKLYLFILIAWFGSLATALAGPKIEVKERDWDFGIVPHNAEIRHPYWVKNIGDAKLNIIKVKPG
jgi:RNase P/RNase MRP subunit POP5